MDLMDRREKERQEERQRKIQMEKDSRNRQLYEENQRKRMERKREKDLDDLLVTRIKEELSIEQQLLHKKREEERNHLQKVLRENETNKRKLEEE